MDIDGGASFTEEDIVLTVKILAEERDVRNITGKNENTLRQIRSQSGAGISISEGPSPDRIVMITGSLEETYEACRLVIERFESYVENDHGNEIESFYVKLIVPASQCGPLIGKGGSKIKEIRESTGASLQVSADIFPDSTERSVNISGSVDAICDCIYEICLILLQSPQKFSVVPYQPNAELIEGPVVFANGKAYTVQGSIAVPLADLNFLFKNDLAKSYFGSRAAIDYTLLQRLAKDNPPPKDPDRKNFHLQEIQIPDDILGGTIGRNGIKLAEIRQITGAHVLISDNDTISPDGRERIVTIKGPRESVTLARYLINACIDLQKLSVDSKEESYEPEPESALSTLYSLLSRNGALNILSSITGFSSVTEFLKSFETHHRF